MSPLRWSHRFILCTVSECRFDGAVQHWQARDSYVYAAVSVEVQPSHVIVHSGCRCRLFLFYGAFPWGGPRVRPLSSALTPAAAIEAQYSLICSKRDTIG